MGVTTGIFGLYENTSLPSAIKIYALTAGFALAGAVAWILASIIRLPAGLPLFAVATIHIVLVAAGNMLGIRAAAALCDSEIDRLEWLSTTVAVWLAPLAVYVEAGSIYAVPMAAIFAVQAAFVFRLTYRHTEPDLIVYHADLFHLQPPPSPAKLLSLVFAAACVEVSVAGSASGSSGAGAAFMAAGAGVAAWHFSSGNVQHVPCGGPRQFASSVLTMILALSLTAGGLSRGFGDGSGEGDGAARLDGGIGGKYWGVILLTDVPSLPQQLINPALPAFGEGLRIPMKIHFDGVYWVFRPPDLRPPADATIIHGSPDETGFLSTDSTPLLVEAHQKLPARMPLTCCEKIDVRLRNADGYPGTIGLELFLMDSALSSDAWISLGRITLVSQQKIEYRIPEDPRISTFDEVAFRFHLESSRETQSPRIAIEDLVMIPR